MRRQTKRRGGDGELFWKAFAVEVPEGATIKKVLEQIGKGTVMWYSLQRGGGEVDGGLQATVRNDDHLFLRC